VLILESEEFTVNTAFDGDNDTDLLTGIDTLEAGNDGAIYLTVRVVPGDDLTGYENNVEASATAPGSGLLTDISTDGSDPDPNNDGNPDEMVPTPIDFDESPVLGVAKRLSEGPINNGDGSYDLTFEIRVENLGDVGLGGLQVAEDLANTFALANSFDVLVLESEEFTINTNFDGENDINLLTGIDTIEAGNDGAIYLTIRVQPGDVLTGYLNNVEATATSPGGTALSDISTDGSDPDPNNDGNPEEDDPTPIDFESEIDFGVSKRVSDGPINNGDGSYDLTFEIRVENFGTVDVGQLQLEDTLAVTFANAVSWEVLSVESEEFTVNTAYDGDQEHDLLTGTDTLEVGNEGAVYLKVRVVPGSVLTGYENQVRGLGVSPTEAQFADFSVNGSDPDPNNNGSGEEDSPTPIDFMEDARLGVAKRVSDGPINNGDGSYDVTFEIRAENFGDVDLGAIQVTEDLAFTFGNADGFNVVSVESEEFTVNTAYDGDNDINLLTGIDTLEAGNDGAIYLTVRVVPGDVLTGYLNNVVLTGTPPTGTPISDTSTDGSDPDPNNDGNPEEDDPTPVDFMEDARIGVAKRVSDGPTNNGDGSYDVTFEIRVENFGDVGLGEIQVTENLANTFANADSFAIVSLESEEFTANVGFNGDGDINLLTGIDTLEAGNDGAIYLTVRVFPGDVLTGYLNNVVATGTPPTGTPISDTSTDGSDPDPNNDGNPEEDEPTPVDFEQVAQVGIAKRVSTGPILEADNTYTVTYEIRVENFGNVALDNVQVTDDLATTFAAAGGFTVVSVESEEFTVNTAYNGDTDINLLAGDDILTAGNQGAIYLTVNVTPGNDGETYFNSATVTADSPTGDELTDDSQNGSEPDPDGDGDPTDNNEDTPVTLDCFVNLVCPSIPDTVTVENDFGMCMAVVNLPPSTIETCAGVPDTLYEFMLEGAGADGLANNSWIEGQPLSLAYNVGVTKVSVRASVPGLPALGFSNICTFYVEVLDKQAPDVVCQDLNVNVDDKCSYLLMAADVDGGTSDNCTDLANLTLEISTDGPDSGFGPGVVFDDIDYNNSPIIVWFRVTDEAGNSAVCATEVTLIDNTAPTIDCPADVTDLTCGQPLPAPLTTLDDFVAAGGTIYDNCGVESISHIDYDNGLTVCPNDGIRTITREYTITDVFGNEATCTQTFQYLEDDTEPTFTGDTPPDFVGVDALSCGETIPPVTDYTITATDNCGEVTIEFSETYLPGAGVNDGNLLVRTWNAIDACGNVATLTQQIEVMDEQAPTFNEPLPGNLTFQCADLIPAAPVLTAMDDCEGVIDVDFSESIDPGDCPNTFTMVRTWTATDGAGNVTQHVQTIYVFDNKAPVWIGDLPDELVELECGEDVPAAETLEAVDNCAGQVIVEFNETFQPGSGPNGGMLLVRTWTAYDLCGNSTEFVQVITIDDAEAPVWNDPLPEDILDASCAAEVPAAPELTATDNCEGVLDADFSEQIQPGDCPNDFTITRTWTVTDAAGNSIQHVQTITVNDTEAPQFVGDLPANESGFECGEEVPAAPELTATDNCGGQVFVEFNETYLPGAGVNNGNVIVRTWTAYDACGNTAQHVQEIEVNDTTAPEWTTTDLPEDENLECAEEVTVAVVLEAVDNCGAVLDVDMNEKILPGACVNDFTLVRTWTATDAAGNSIEHVQTIVVEDTEGPVWTGMTQVDLVGDNALSCGDEVPVVMSPVPVDNCGGQIIVEFSETFQPGGGINAWNVITRTWVAYDACGNSTELVQVIEVEDMEAPVWTSPLPEDLEVACADAVPAAVELEADDNCDAAIDIDFSEEILPGGCPNAFLLIRTWTATDIVGNSIEHVQTITVSDTEAPVFVGDLPEDLTGLACGEDVPPVAEVEATDNCGSVVIGFNETYLPGAGVNNGNVIVRTWTAYDACGNSTQHVQTIEVNDTEAPSWTTALPGDELLACAEEVTAAAVLEATDNCDNVVDVDMSEKLLPGACENDFTLVRTWTATDGAGNSIEHVQTINVMDNEAPAFVGDLPADMTGIACGEDVPAAADLEVTDNCAGQVIVEFNETYLPGAGVNNGNVIVRTWTAYDACGNSTQHVQTIEVNDTEAPSWLTALPGDETLSCAEDVDVAATLVATDNCDNVVDVDFSETYQPGGCDNNFTLVRSWTATDGAGNSIQHVQTIDVSDTEAPAFVGDLPQDMTGLECGEDVPAAATLEATDNCGQVTVEFNETYLPGAGVNNGNVIVRTWTATDACGNSTQHVQQIEVNDTTAPVWTSDLPKFWISLVCSEDVPAAAELTAVDNCDNVVDIDFSEQIQPGSCPNDFILIRIWTATDGAGNSIQYTQTIQVTDNEAPVFLGNLPQDLLGLECGEDIPPAETLYAVDNCEGEVIIDFNETYLPGMGVNNANVIVRTWTAYDVCGNSVEHVQTIEVNDNEDPQWTVTLPGDKTYSCADEVQAAAQLSAVDNCYNPVDIDFSEEILPGGCPNSFTLIRTWTAQDGAGNGIEHVQTIVVSDEEAPFFNEALPQPYVNVSCSEGIPSAATLTATDNCDGLISVEFSEVFEPGANLNEASKFIRTWVATDACGNEVTHQQVVEVLDTEAPAFDAPLPPAAISVSCAEDVPAAAILTATDNCGAEVDVDVTEFILPGACTNDFMIERVYTAIDGVGNSVEYVQTIIVNDDEAPVFNETLPDALLSFQCAEEVPDAAILTASDNCEASVDVDFSETIQSGSVNNSLEITRTWTATDPCGNQTVHVQNIIVLDTTAPEISCPATTIHIGTDGEILAGGDAIESISFEGCGVTLQYAAPLASDNCPGELTINVSGLGAGPNFYPYGGTYTETYEVIDQAGNSSSCSFTIIIDDTTDPVITCPEDIILNNDPGECGAVVTYSNPLGSDNCPGYTVTLIDGLPSGSVFPLGTTNVAFQVTDDFGNVVNCNFTVTILDTEAPVISCPEAVTLTCGEAVPAGATVIDDFLTLGGTASDNCDAVSALTVSFVDDANNFSICDDDGIYTITRTYTITDTHGNASTCEQYFYYEEDAEAPQITEAVSTTVECDGAGNTAALDAWLAENGGLTVLGDNCTATADIVVSNELLSIDNGCAETAVYTYAFTATDGCGNAATSTASFTIEDTTAPVITAEATDVSVECDGAGNTAALLSWLNTYAGADAEDMCSSKLSWSNDYAAANFISECGNTGYVDVTFTAMDECGNMSTTSARFTITDNTSPEFVSCPAPEVVTGSEVDLCGAYVNYTQPDAIDGCGSVTITQVDGTGLSSGDLFPIGTTTLIYEAVDECGNVSTCMFDVVVEDTQIPDINCPADVVIGVSTDGTGDCTTAVPDIGLEVVTGDNCDYSVTYTITDPTGQTTTGQDDASGEVFSLGVSTVTYTVTDENGNTISCSFFVVVVDDEAPQITCPLVDPIYTNDPGECLATITGLLATASDVCSSVSITNDSGNGTADASGAYEVGTHTVVFTATDGAGNTATCEVSFEVVDTEAPEITCPVDITVGNDPGVCGATVTYTFPIASDNCPNYAIALVDGPISGSVFPLGTTTVAFEVTDDAGNTAECSFTVTVEDIEAPVIIAYTQDVTVTTSSNGTGDCTGDVPDLTDGVIVEDNCDIHAGSGVSTGVITLTQSPAAGTPFGGNHLATQVVIITATDEAGNSVSVEAVVTLVDDEDPTIDCVADADLCTDAGECGTFIADDSLDPDFDDNCHPILTHNCTFAPNSNTLAGTTFPLGTTEVVWTVTDEAGNTASCMITITVSDCEAPNFVNCPVTTVLVGNDVDECSAAVNWSIPVPIDNCDDDLAITQIAGPQPGTVIPVGEVFTVTYEAVDDAGNTAQCSFEVEVIDTQDPDFKVAMPLDEVVECDAVPAPFVVTASDVEDNCTAPEDILITFIETSTQGDDPNECDFYNYVITRTWIIEDEAGNTEDYTQTVTVQDTEAPTFTVPVDLTIECDMSTDPSNTGEPTDLLDNCALEDNLTVEFTDVSTQSDDPAQCSFYTYTITRTWTVSDPCGNSTTAVQVIDVEDTTAPMVLCQDITVELDANGQVTISANQINGGVMDNCAPTDELTLSLDENNFNCDDLGDNTVVLTVTDPCGNSAACIATVTVEDNMAPELTCPSDVTLNLDPGACDIAYSFPLLATDNCDVTVSSVPESGSFFPIGTTTVTVTAEDEAGNITTCTFDVTVVEFPTDNETLTCNDFVTLALDGDCEEEITADLVLEGNEYGCYEDYTITVIDEFGEVVPGNLVTFDYLGQTLIVTVTDPATGNFCTTEVLVVDNLVPEVECPVDVTVGCNASTDPSATGEPILLSCEPNVNITYKDVTEDFGFCDDPAAVITRTFTITDGSGNSVECVQTITIEAFDLEDVAFPDNFDFSAPLNCSDVLDDPTLIDPANTGYPTIAGVPINENAGTYCKLSFNMSDEIFTICEGSYEILRTWKVRDICEPLVPGVNPVEYIQVIQVIDTEGPEIVGPADVTIDADAGCEGTFVALPPEVTDNCASIDEILIIGPSGQILEVGEFVSGLPLGDNVFTYIVKDGCNNKSEPYEFTVTVEDMSAPVPVCDEQTQIGIGADGNAVLCWPTIEDGSYDNCGIEAYKIKRMDAPSSTPFTDCVDFSCDDIGSTILVRLRVYDIVGNFTENDPNARFNECVAEVEVTDALEPSIVCPPNQTLDCGEYDANVWDGVVGDPAAGVPVYKLPENELIGYYANTFDNCGVERVNVSSNGTPDQCGGGTITRIYTAVDVNGLTSSCVQILTLGNATPFDITDTDCNNANPNDGVEWPCDIELNSCGAGLAPDELESNPAVNAEDARPQIVEDVCDLVGVSYEDTELPITAPGCVKLIRTWSIVDWCQPDASYPLGYVTWTYNQEIKVLESDAPEILSSCEDVTIDGYEDDCQPIPAELILDAADDCTDLNDLVYYYQIDAFFDPTEPGSPTYDFDSDNNPLANATNAANEASGEYPIGTHFIHWTVEDGCGNFTSCSYTFEVRDAMPPTPICKVLTTPVMPQSGMVHVWASSFENGDSYDNCTPYEDLLFSFSSDVTDTIMFFNCDDVGTTQDVEIWATDEYGNQDFCQTTIEITDPTNSCNITYGISGVIKTEYDDPVADVDVTVTESSSALGQTVMTPNGGSFLFTGLPEGSNYTVTPEKDINYLNGVTTFDLVLIQQHVLAMKLLDSPYKVIAADVSNDGQVTTFDVVELRKLILHIVDELPDNTSWRFVDEDYVFPDPMNPFAPAFPEVVDYNDLAQDELLTDFIGVKIGDVDGNALANEFMSGDDRTASSEAYFDAEDVDMLAGETVSVTLRAGDFDKLHGYQFTLEFDNEALELVDVNGNELAGISEANFGMRFLEEGAITTSWHQPQAELKEGSELFTVFFTAQRSGKLSDYVNISSRFTRAEAYRQLGESINYEYADPVLRWTTPEGDQQVVDGFFELYQNMPNPFKDATVIGFNLPEAQTATLKIYDTSGKVIQLIEGEFSKGFNTVNLNRTDMEINTGILYYQLETDTHTATKKMIIIE
jgi:hypothetical protein